MKEKRKPLKMSLLSSGARRGGFKAPKAYTSFGLRRKKR